MGVESSTDVTKLDHEEVISSEKTLGSSEFTAKSKIPRAKSTDSIDDPWGWFEDFENPRNDLIAEKNLPNKQQKPLSLPPPASTPPIYILESSLETQHLWYTTAGQRPKQPDNERKFYEKLWMKNFETSSISYSNLQNVDNIPQREFTDEIIFRGKGPFSNSVSKSFSDHNVSSINLQLPRFRIMKCNSGKFYAEFLVVVSMQIESTVTFGVWRRHSDFSKLVHKLQTVQSQQSSQSEMFKNSLISWKCLLNRKRWYRCVDKDYLSLKCFLLERFMQDFLFESPTPELVNQFLCLH